MRREASNRGIDAAVARWLGAALLLGSHAVVASEEPRTPAASPPSDAPRTSGEVPMQSRPRVEPHTWDAPVWSTQVFDSRRVNLPKSELPYALRPRRRDAPLRELNISDDEVREIRGVLGADARPGMLNIGGVVTGCPCEDGPACREQVWVVISRPDASVGRLLSRIDGRWTIGPVQAWWLRREAIDAQRRTLGTLEYLKATERLDAEFPACSADPRR